jgi:signal transduction histidine kinase
MLNKSKAFSMKPFILLLCFLFSVVSLMFFVMQMLNYDKERELYDEKVADNALLFASMELMQISQDLVGLDQRRSISLYSKEYEEILSEYNRVLSVFNSPNTEQYYADIRRLLLEFSDFNNEVKARNDHIYRRNNLKVILDNSLDLSTSEENSYLLNILLQSLESKNMLVLGEYYRDFSNAFDFSELKGAERDKVQKIAFGTMNVFNTMEKIIYLNVVLNRSLEDVIYKTNGIREKILNSISREDGISNRWNSDFGYFSILISLIFIGYLYLSNKTYENKIITVYLNIRKNFNIIRLLNDDSEINNGFVKIYKNNYLEEILLNIKVAKLVLDYKKNNFIIVNQLNTPIFCSESLFKDDFEPLALGGSDRMKLTASIQDNHYFLSEERRGSKSIIYDCDLDFSIAIPNENKTLLFLNSASDERSRQNDRLDSLASISGAVAHDINNMIAVIVSSLSILRESKYLTLHSDRKVIDSALFSADKSIGLIDRLLTFARCKRLSPEIVDVNALLEGLYEVISFATSDHVTIEYELSSKPLYTYIDPGQLETSIINLCLNSNNAIHESGYIKIKTEVSPTNRLSIIVEDNGHGIPKSIQGRVFEPFFTGRKQGEGHGLGLSMVYGFVTQSGGSIALESQVGKGTTVSISFSLKKT